MQPSVHVQKGAITLPRCTRTIKLPCKSSLTPFRTKFGPALSPKHRSHCVVVKASDSNSNGPNEEPPSKSKQEMNTLLSLLVAYPGVRGTAAVVAGYFLHISPLGSLHLFGESVLTDAAVGLALALPVSMLDATIVLGNWEPKRTIKKVKMKIPRSIAAQMPGVKITSDDTNTTTPTSVENNNNDDSTAPTVEQQQEEQHSTITASTTTDSTTNSTSATIDLLTSTLESPETTNAAKTQAPPPPPPMTDYIEIEREIPVRSEHHPLRDALYRLQYDKVMLNPGRILSPPSELFLLATVHLAEEMLYRGVLLSVAAKWFTDLIYTTTYEDTVSLFGLIDLSIPQAGALIAGSGMSLTALILAVQSELLSPQLAAYMEAIKSVTDKEKKSNNKQQEDNTNAKDKAESEEESIKMTRIKEALEEAKQKIEANRRWAVFLKASQEFLEWTTLSASFLITGNLLAPLAGSIASDAMYSVMQRWKYEQLSGSRARDRNATLAQMGLLQQAALAKKAQRAERLAKLEPPRGLNGSSLGDSSGSDDNGYAGKEGDGSNAIMAEQEQNDLNNENNEKEAVGTVSGSQKTPDDSSL